MLSSADYLIYLGKAIAKLREEADLRQVELAAASDLQRTYIAEVEMGKRNLSLKSLVKIADALEVSLSELLQKAEALANSEN